jgi:putative toxin-antitoxin system antitoxin component (TIGR02293 family)
MEDIAMGELLGAAKILGLDKPSSRFSSDIQYLEWVEGGLPVKCLDVISDVIAPGDSSFKYRIVSKATVARRKLSRKLSPAQSVLVTRLASVWDLALRVWKTPDDAREFLFRSHQLLDDRPPIVLVLENEIGAELVRNILGRLENGSAV